MSSGFSRLEGPRDSCSSPEGSQPYPPFNGPPYDYSKICPAAHIFPVVALTERRGSDLDGEGPWSSFLKYPQYCWEFHDNSSERPSPEPLLTKKRRPQPYWGGENSGFTLWKPQMP